MPHSLTSPLPILASDLIEAEDSIWQKELSQSNIHLGALLDQLAIPGEQQMDVLASQQAERDFPLRVTPSFIERMQMGDRNDPLLQQILPKAEETLEIEGYSTDPLEEKSSNPLPGLLHKYKSRALLTVANSCAINCRYCFRRHFSYSENNPSKKQWEGVFNYLREHTEINEVVYSGGDPLVSNDRYLAWLTESLNEIEHLKRLRIHSRLPIVLPGRVTESFIDTLSIWQGQRVMVIHCNHPNEIDHAVAQAVLKLRNANISVLNQSVLLKGINDHTDVLAKLSEKLFDIGVMPYYLHQLDPVKGAAHFAIDDEAARQIEQELRAKLAGFLVPKFVRELAGQPGKTPL